MSPGADLAQAIGRGFPRVSGDEPAGSNLVDVAAGFSPRERG